MSFPFANGTLFIVLILIWTIPWKAASLWISARRGDAKWFIALIVLNTLGILEIIYIFGVAKKRWRDLKKFLRK